MVDEEKNLNGNAQNAKGVDSEKNNNSKNAKVQKDKDGKVLNAKDAKDVKDVKIPTDKPISSNVENITVNLQVVLATKHYKIRELNNLKISDVIKIGTINDFVFIYANDIAIAKGELVSGEEGVFVEITQIL